VQLNITETDLRVGKRGFEGSDAAFGASPFFFAKAGQLRRVNRT
jgi:hypothetical protein